MSPRNTRLGRHSRRRRREHAEWVEGEGSLTQRARVGGRRSVGSFFITPCLGVSAGEHLLRGGTVESPEGEDFHHRVHREHRVVKLSDFVVRLTALLIESASTRVERAYRLGRPTARSMRGRCALLVETWEVPGLLVWLIPKVRFTVPVPTTSFINRRTIYDGWSLRFDMSVTHADFDSTCVAGCFEPA